MSYLYRDRESERDYDERPVTIKRYVVPSEDRDDRRDFMMRREDPYSGEREMVIRRKADREEPMTISRYEREIDYQPPARRERDYEREYHHHHHRYPEPPGPMGLLPLPVPSIVVEDQTVMIREAPRESGYDVIRRSDADDDPYYYHQRRRVREYDDRPARRELSPGDSISQASRRHRGDREDYSSDDSIVYVRKETREYEEDHPHHRRHLLEGALAGAGAAEIWRSHRKRDGEEVSRGVSHAAKTAGAGALGAVAVNAAGHVRDYYRSKSRSRHRSHSFDDERSRHSHRRSRGRSPSRSRSRSHSHSRTKTLLELGLGAAAVAAGVAAMRNKGSKDKDDDRRSRSRTRSRSRSHARALSTNRSEKDGDETRSQSQRNKHMAGAGLAGAAVAGLVERARSHSRSRKGGRSRSRSRFRQALPIVAAGLGTAAATGIYEKKKADKDGKDGKEPVSRERRRSRSHSRGPAEAYPDPSRDSAGLIEYGNHPVAGNIPAEHYYGAPASPQPAYYSDGAEFGRRHSRSRSRSRGGRREDGSSGSEREERRRNRGKKHRSRSREIAEAALGATGLGYAAHKYSQHRDRKKADKYAEEPPRDPYEESYDPEPYPPSPRAGGPPPPMDNYYPGSNYFPPPPSSQNLNATPQPYNPADYPPPPGAAPPPQPYSYGAGPGPEMYAPRARRAEENVSAPENYHSHDGGFTEPQPPNPNMAKL